MAKSLVSVVVRVALMLMTWCCVVLGQSQSPALAFEVASLKVHEGNVPLGGGHHVASGPKLTFEAYSILGLIMYAYNLKPHQISTAASLDPTPYDVSAKAEGDRTPSAEEFRFMMQSLLMDRFKLKAHRETRDTPVYALVAGKKGLKLKESTPESQFASRTALRQPNFQATLTKVSVDFLVEYIQGNARLDRPVVNQTGLTGSYDIELTYTPEYRIGQGPPADLGAQISVFQAVKDQLGLELVRRNAPYEMLVIDHVEKPSKD